VPVVPKRPALFPSPFVVDALLANTLYFKLLARLPALPQLLLFVMHLAVVYRFDRTRDKYFLSVLPFAAAELGVPPGRPCFPWRPFPFKTVSLPKFFGGCGWGGGGVGVWGGFGGWWCGWFWGFGVGGGGCCCGSFCLDVTHFFFPGRVFSASECAAAAGLQRLSSFSFPLTLVDPPSRPTTRPLLSHWPRRARGMCPTGPSPW